MDGLVSKDPYKPHYVKIFVDKHTVWTIENVDRHKVFYNMWHCDILINSIIAHMSAVAVMYRANSPPNSFPWDRLFGLISTT